MPTDRYEWFTPARILRAAQGDAPDRLLQLILSARPTHAISVFEELQPPIPEASAPEKPKKTPAQEKPAREKEDRAEVEALSPEAPNTVPEPSEASPDPKPSPDELIDRFLRSGDYRIIAEEGEAEAEEDPAVEPEAEAVRVEESGEVAVEEIIAEPVKPAAVKMVSFGDYASQVMGTGATSKNKIAVIYAEGSIVSGQGAQGEIGSVAMVEKIKRAREDENVKAVVFRINSPGGSALASEVMWRELTLLKAEKPLIVSMGNYAASGGYYIASPADVIYADRSTLTGSIGVFGLFANVGGALKGKLGITTDVVNTNRYSDVGSMYRTPSSSELAYFQKSVEDVYSTFVGHVAEGRNMTPEAVDKIGQGRVWSGADALEIGLIDGFGGIFNAIALAADRVGVADDFRIYEVIDTPTGFEALLSGFSVRVRRSVLQDELGEAFVHYEHLRGMLDGDEVQARMPYVVEIR